MIHGTKYKKRFAEQGEIEKGLYATLHFDAVSTNQYWQNKQLNGINGLIDERDILFEHAATIAESIVPEGHRANVFDLYASTFYSSLPLMYELMVRGKLARYNPVLTNQRALDNATDNCKNFLYGISYSHEHNNYTKEHNIQLSQTHADIVYSDISEIVSRQFELDALESQIDINIFIMMSSVFGTLSDAERALNNIYTSMKEGDKCIIHTAIHSDEDKWLQAARHVLPSLQIAQDTAHAIDPYSQIEVTWKNNGINEGVYFDIITQQSGVYAGVEFDALKRINIFKQAKPHEKALIRAIEKAKLKIDMIHYGREKSSILCVLSKS